MLVRHGLHVLDPCLVRVRVGSKVRLFHVWDTGMGREMMSPWMLRSVAARVVNMGVVPKGSYLVHLLAKPVVHLAAHPVDLSLGFQF